MSINVWVGIGRLTYAPEIKTTSGGVSVIRFQLAVDRNYQKQGEERKADFIDCVAFRSTAEFIGRYFHKGSMIAVEGSIQTDNFTDKDGNKRKSVVIVANNVSFCGDKEKPSQGFTQPETPHPADVEYEEIPDDDDDLPF